MNSTVLNVCRTATVYRRTDLGYKLVLIRGSSSGPGIVDCEILLED